LRRVLLAVALLGVVAGAVPATAARPPTTSGPTTVSFDGETWLIKAAKRQMGPGPNLFSASNVRRTDDGALHLSITKSGRTWSCAEVILDHALGYGTYEWTVSGPVDQLDRNVVLGLFTWEDAPSSSPTNREIDIELARWGSSTDPTNAQYVVQPYDNPGNLQRFAVPAATSVTLRFTWSPGQVVAGGSARLSDGSTVQLQSWTNTGPDVPTPANERVHMNLWLYDGKAPSDSKPVDITLTDFTYTRP
jgi:hypothetical protein